MGVTKSPGGVLVANGGTTTRESQRSTRTPTFVLGVLVVSLVALAFSVGRHFPIDSVSREEDENWIETGAPLRSLEEITKSPAIAFDRLEVDRGGLESSSSGATPQAKRGDRDDD